MIGTGALRGQEARINGLRKLSHLFLLPAAFHATAAEQSSGHAQEGGRNNLDGRQLKRQRPFLDMMQAGRADMKKSDQSEI